MAHEEYAQTAVAERAQYEHLLPQVPPERVIRSTVLQTREVGDEAIFTPLPPTIAPTRGVQDGSPDRSGVVYQREGGAFYAAWAKADAQGHVYAGAVTALVENNNITWVEFRHAAPRQPIEQQIAFRVDPTYKIDDMVCYVVKRDDDPARADLVVFLTTHSVGMPIRLIAWEFAVIENIWAYSATAEIESEGGLGGYRGGDNLPPPPMPEVDIEQLKTAMREVIGLPDNAPLLQHFGSHRNVRTGIMEKDQDALGVEQNETVTQGGQQRRGHLLNFADKIAVAVIRKLTPGPGSSFEFYAQQINTGYQAAGVMLCEAGLWDGVLPNGQRMRHPLTGQPLICPQRTEQ